jgi:citrate synthase
MSNPVVEELLKHRGKLLARDGGWLAGKGVYSHGHDLLKEMLPNKRYFHVLMLNALGRVPEDRFCDWVEAIFICLSWPDPRIWCNGIGALAGSAQTTSVAATAAGMLASDSVMYGPYTVQKGIEFINKVVGQIEDGASVKTLVEAEIKRSGGKVHIMGYARPIATGDERVEAMLGYGEALGYEVGRHLQVALDIEKYLLENYNESLNINGYASAFLADQGISPEQAYNIFPSVVNSGVTACYVEQKAKPLDSYLPLTCEDIEYTGPELRQL